MELRAVVTARQGHGWVTRVPYHDAQRNAMPVGVAHERGQGLSKRELPEVKIDWCHQVVEVVGTALAGDGRREEGGGRREEGGREEGRGREGGGARRCEEVQGGRQAAAASPWLRGTRDQGRHGGSTLTCFLTSFKSHIV